MKTVVVVVVQLVGSVAVVVLGVKVMTIGTALPTLPAADRSQTVDICNSLGLLVAALTRRWNTVLLFVDGVACAARCCCVLSSHL